MFKLTIVLCAVSLSSVSCRNVIQVANHVMGQSGKHNKTITGKDRTHHETEVSFEDAEIMTGVYLAKYGNYSQNTIDHLFSKLTKTTNEAIKYKAEDNTAITEINTMYDRTGRILKDFNETMMNKLRNHTNKILTRIDYLVSNMAKEIDEFAISQMNDPKGSLVCLEDWFEVKRLAMKAEIEECLELQRKQLENCTESLKVKLDNIMMVDIFYKSQNCEKIIVSPDKSNAADKTNDKTICYEELVSDVRAILGRFKNELKEIKTALRSNNPTPINLGYCRPSRVLGDYVQEYLQYSRENKKCYADVQRINCQQLILI